MDLIREVNLNCTIPLVRFDKLVFGKEKDGDKPVMTWLILNNHFDKALTVPGDNDNETIPIFSLYVTHVANLFSQDITALHTFKSKDSVDVTHLADQFEPAANSSTFDCWTFIKSKTLATDLFSDDAGKVAQPFEYVSDSVTAAMVHSQYHTKPVVMKHADGSMRILGMIILEQPIDAERVPSSEEKKMITHLRNHNLAAMRTSLGV